MRFIHISDLHLGRRVHGYDVSEEQQHALQQVLDACDQFDADGLLIAGDIYDTPNPSADAVRILDEFLYQLARRKIDVFLCAGNHDSGARLDFGARVLKDSHIYVYGEYNGQAYTVTKEKEGQIVNIHLLPFIKPRSIRPFVQEKEEISTYSQAFAWAKDQLDLKAPGLHILAAHQFFAGARVCESEEIVGTLEAVDAGLLEGFDYCALGHLHNPQSIKKTSCRYSGTPIKYSTSEIGVQKSMVLIDTNGPQDLEGQMAQTWPGAQRLEEEKLGLFLLPIRPLRDFVRIQGTYEELVSRSFYRDLDRENYFDIILNDSQDVPGAFEKLNLIYPRILRLQYAGRERQTSLPEADRQMLKARDPLELMAEFYQSRMGQPLSQEQSDILHELWQEAYNEV